MLLQRPRSSRYPRNKNNIMNIYFSIIFHDIVADDALANGKYLMQLSDELFKFGQSISLPVINLFLSSTMLQLQAVCDEDTV